MERPTIKMTGAKPPAPPLKTVAKVADLVPLEGAVIGPSVTDYRKQIAGGATIPPPTVVVLNGEHLVVDGNHRVYAALQEGQPQIDVMISPGSKSLEKYRIDKLAHALRRGRKGFANLTVVASQADREVFTEQERVDDEKHDFDSLHQITAHDPETTGGLEPRAPEAVSKQPGDEDGGHGQDGDL